MNRFAYYSSFRGRKARRKVAFLIALLTSLVPLAIILPVAGMQQARRVTPFLIGEVGAFEISNPVRVLEAVPPRPQFSLYQRRLILDASTYFRDSFSAEEREALRKLALDGPG